MHNPPPEYLSILQAPYSITIHGNEDYAFKSKAYLYIRKLIYTLIVL